MRLLLDVGNTRCKWRLLDGEHIVAHGVLDEEGVLAEALAALPRPASIHGCCVASAERQQQLTGQCLRRWGQAPHWLQVQSFCCGLRNDYLSAGLGVDRWASAIAAHERLRGSGCVAAVAINAGTALTIDVVRADGVYAGGTISPGLGLMRTSLAQGTARLPLAQGQFESIPRTTDSAILTGTLDAACGAIERMLARVGAPALVLLSGGDAHWLAQHLPVQVETVENLVLDGLQVITR